MCDDMNNMNGPTKPSVCNSAPVKAVHWKHVVS